MLAALLRDMQRVAHVILHHVRDSRKSLRLDPTHTTGLKDGSPVIAV
jgi:hypothetical protein